LGVEVVANKDFTSRNDKPPDFARRSSNTKLPENFKIRPIDIKKNNGFYLSIDLSWKRIDASIIFEDFSKKLINSISNPTNEKIDNFMNILGGAIDNGQKIELGINSKTSKDIRKLLRIPEVWQTIDLALSIPHVDKSELIPDLVLMISEDLLGLILSLMDLKEKDKIQTDEDIIGYPEGALSLIKVNKYERNRINRKCCLNKHGYKCKVCYFDFEKVYGQIGKNFIQVHHITLVSKIGPDYVIDPVNDLIPLCSNCHSMAHRQTPPFSVAQLKSLIKNS